MHEWYKIRSHSTPHDLFLARHSSTTKRTTADARPSVWSWPRCAWSGGGGGVGGAACVLDGDWEQLACGAECFGAVSAWGAAGVLRGCGGAGAVCGDSG